MSASLTTAKEQAIKNKAKKGMQQNHQVKVLPQHQKLRLLVLFRQQIIQIGLPMSICLATLLFTPA